MIDRQTDRYDFLRLFCPYCSFNPPAVSLSLSLIKPLCFPHFPLQLTCNLLFSSLLLTSPTVVYFYSPAFCSSSRLYTHIWIWGEKTQMKGIMWRVYLWVNSFTQYDLFCLYPSTCEVNGSTILHRCTVIHSVYGPHFLHWVISCRTLRLRHLDW